MNILESYLDKLAIEDSDLFRLLSRFEKVVIFKKFKEITKGLLKYETISPNTAFLFKMSEEKVLVFHTLGMAFSIDIYFFNDEGKLVSKYRDVKPGAEKVSSKFPAMYAVETLSKGM